MTPSGTMQVPTGEWHALSFPEKHVSLTIFFSLCIQLVAGYRAVVDALKTVGAWVPCALANRQELGIYL